MVVAVVAVVTGLPVDVGPDGVCPLELAREGTHLDEPRVLPGLPDRVRAAVGESGSDAREELPDFPRERPTVGRRSLDPLLGVDRALPVRAVVVRLGARRAARALEPLVVDDVAGWYSASRGRSRPSRSRRPRR